jgi:hypothetical protein
MYKKAGLVVNGSSDAIRYESTAASRSGLRPARLVILSGAQNPVVMKFAPEP